MPGAGCISDANLRDFLLGNLPERVGHSIASHIDRCPECEAAARRLDGLTDTVIDRLRREFDAGAALPPTEDALGPTGPTEPPRDTPRRVAGYEIFEEVGRGGMSVVYRARQVSPSRVVALKVLLAGEHADAERRARFLAEADAFARLRHPNVVQIYEVGEHGGLPFLALEFVEGVTLADRLGGAPLPPRQAAELAEKLARAIHAAHRAGVVHRDLKPANVLLAADGTPKVTDFGLAKQEESDLTATGAVLGTPSYMAPEQAEGRTHEVGPPADVYALGTILYEALTGRPPFRGATHLETLDQVRTREPVAPSQLRAKLPRDLDTVCLTCLRKEPAARYASAEALADDLGRFLRNEPIRARRTGPVGVTWRWCRRNPAVAALLGTVAVLLVALAAGSLWTALRFRAIADAARHEATERLFESKVTEARAKRLSGTVGQRYESLRLLAEAARLSRREGWPEARLAPLRNDAIHSLTRFDIRVSARFGTYGGKSRYYFVSPDLTTEAWDLDETTFTARRTADGREIARVRCPRLGGSVDGSLSRDSRFLAVWTRTRPATAEIRVWDLSRPGSEPTIDVEGDVEFLCWSFTADARRFAFGHSGGTVAVHDPGIGRELQVVRLGGKPEALAFHPKRAWLAVTVENSVEVHDLDRDGEPVVLPLPARGQQVIWHPRRDTLAVAAEDYKVHLWDVPARREVMTLEGFRNGGIFAGFNHAGDLLVTMEWFWTTRFWDLRTGQELLQAPEGYGLTFSEDDRTLAMYAKDVTGANSHHAIEIANRRSLRVLARAPSQGPGIFKDCAFNPRIPVLAAAMNDGFGLWDLRTGDPLTVQAWPRGVNGVRFEESGALLVHGPKGITRWPAREEPASPVVWRYGPPKVLAPPLIGEAYSFAASRDGAVVARGESPAATVWHRDRPGDPIQLVPHNDVRYVEVSPDGRWVITKGHSSQLMKLWRSDTGRLEKEFPPGVSSAQFSPDGRRFATAGDRLRFWEVGSREEKTLPGSGGRVAAGAVAFSTDGKLISLEPGGHVVLVDAATGRDLARIQGPSRENLRSTTFSPDGTLFAGVADFRSIHVWDLRAVRRELAAIGLDWDLPPYPPAPETAAAPIKIEIDPGPTVTAGGR